ncbi:MAG TPA: hypothetical protein VF172_01520, partial [Nitrososphaera sp.]
SIIISTCSCNSSYHDDNDNSSACRRNPGPGRRGDQMYDYGGSIGTVYNLGAMPQHGIGITIIMRKPATCRHSRTLSIRFMEKCSRSCAATGYDSTISGSSHG